MLLAQALAIPKEVLATDWPDRPFYCVPVKDFAKGSTSLRTINMGIDAQLPVILKIQARGP